MRTVIIAVAAGLLTSPLLAQTCTTSLDTHVYHPDRLQPQNGQAKAECMELHGTIRDMRVEKDGDYHIQVKLDSSQPTGEDPAKLINAKNRKIQHGCLVVEPICKGPVTQDDAIAPCKGAKRIRVPEKGSHVRVIGRYVKDTQHGWMELHPVTSITVIP